MLLQIILTSGAHQRLWMFLFDKMIENKKLTRAGNTSNYRGRAPITLIIRPAWPCEARCEKKSSGWQLVHPPVLWIDCGLSPASSNCRRLAAVRSTWRLGPIDEWPEARRLRNSIVFLVLAGSVSLTSRKRSAA